LTEIRVELKEIIKDKYEEDEDERWPEQACVCISIF
jgi:hypothetical protein